MRFNVQPLSVWRSIKQSINALLGEQVEGDIDKGVVNAHLVKRPGEHNYEYRYLFLDVAGTLPHHISLFLGPPLI